MCLILKVTKASEVKVGLRSKGDPPPILQHRIQQQLMNNYIIEEDHDYRPVNSEPTIVQISSDQVEQIPWTPYRQTPYKEEKVDENEPKEPITDDSGLQITVDERTFSTIGNAVNNNMGRFVKTTAKGFRTVVDEAAKFVHSSIQSTIRPKKKRPSPQPNNNSGNGLFDLFGLLPAKNPGQSIPTYGSPVTSYGAPQIPNTGYGNPSSLSPSSGYGAPAFSNPGNNYGTPSPSPLPVTAIPTSAPPSQSYGVPQAPVSSSYGVPQAPVSSSYGVPQAPPVSVSSGSSYGAPQGQPLGTSSNYGTSFQDIQLENVANSVGPSIHSLQTHSTTLSPSTSTNHKPIIASTVNPFLSNIQHSTTSTTTTPLPFLDTIYRPKRNKKLRPGTPPSPFFQSTILGPASTSSSSTTRSPPFLVNTFPNRPPVEAKSKELRQVKLAWYNYYRKASHYVKKYKERIDVKKFKRSFQTEVIEKARPNNTKVKLPPRPSPTPKPQFQTLKPFHSPSTPGPHPRPFAGQVHLQLPFKAGRPLSPKRPLLTNKAKKRPLFTFGGGSRPPPRPPSPRPFRRRTPSINFVEINRRENPEVEEEVLETREEANDLANYDGILTPNYDDNDYTYDYQDYDYYDDFFTQP